MHIRPSINVNLMYIFNQRHHHQLQPSALLHFRLCPLTRGVDAVHVVTATAEVRQRTYSDLHSSYFSAPPAACVIPVSPGDTGGPSSHRPASLPGQCTSAGREKQTNTGLMIRSFKMISKTSQQEQQRTIVQCNS